MILTFLNKLSTIMIIVVYNTGIKNIGLYRNILIQE